MRRPSLSRARGDGFALVEVLVVIGIIALLIGLMIPTIMGVKESARRAECASNMRQIGAAMFAYAAEQRGYVPRGGLYPKESGPNHPIWLVAVAPFLGAPANWQWSDLRAMKVLHCRAHPLEDTPATYVLNNFDFTSGPPDWRPSPPTQLGSVKRPAEVPWLLEAMDLFGESVYGPFDGIYFEPYFHVWSPLTLGTRVHYFRHALRSNVLYWDGHVDLLDAMRRRPPLEWFDDGIRSR